MKDSHCKNLSQLLAYNSLQFDHPHKKNDEIQSSNWTDKFPMNTKSKTHKCTVE